MNYSSFAKCVKKDIRKAGKPVYIEEKEVLRNFSQNRSLKSILSNLRDYHGIHGTVIIRTYTRYIVFSNCEKKVDNSLKEETKTHILHSIIENLQLENQGYQKRIRKTSILIDLAAAISTVWLVVQIVANHYGK